MESAILIHSLDWKLSSDSIELDSGITLNKTEGSSVEKLYHRLCANENIDQGEPFMYSTHIRLADTAHDELWPYWPGPFSVISKVCNMIAMCTSSPLGACRLIVSSDEFNSSFHSVDIYEEPSDMDFLLASPENIKIKNGSIIVSEPQYPFLDERSAALIVDCWKNIRELDSSGNDNHRIQNAMSYFFYSWRAYYIEHVCLNLAIVIETLFSPGSNLELSHQIAFNVAKHCGRGSTESERIYKLIRMFYNLRSQIVHGGSTSIGDQVVITPQVFHLTADLLRGICADEKMLLRFCNNSERKKMISQWLFT